MTEDEVWLAIESTRPPENYSIEEHVALLTELISALPEEKFEEFADTFYL